MKGRDESNGRPLLWREKFKDTGVVTVHLLFAWEDEGVHENGGCLPDPMLPQVPETKKQKGEEDARGDSAKRTETFDEQTEMGAFAGMDDVSVPTPVSLKDEKAALKNVAVGEATAGKPFGFRQFQAKVKAQKVVEKG